MEAAMTVLDSVDVDLTKVALLGQSLLEKFNSIRAVSPIYWSPINKIWIVTGHAEVVEGLHGGLPLSSNRLPKLFTYMPEEDRPNYPLILGLVPRLLISLDPPEQGRLRRLMMKAFSRKVAESYRPYAREIIEQTLDSAPEEVDFVHDVSRQIPARIILRLLGIDQSYLPKVHGWVWAFMTGLSGGGTTPELLMQCEEVVGEMRELFLKEIHRRRESPTEDFISALVTAEEDGQGLDEEDILTTCYLTLAAGYDTTANTMTLGTLALANHPQAWAFVRDHPESIDANIMEIMRFVGMSTSTARVVSRDFEWKGHQLKAGQIVQLMQAGANRDPAVFPNAEVMDFSHNQQGNMVFAPGVHFCIGHFLAKMQLTEFYPALLRKFNSIDVLDTELHWGPALTFRGLQSLNVRLNRH
jgi:cytochrome P450